MTELIIVDTCIWVSFFSRSGSAVKDEVKRLLKRNQVAVIGPIVAEVLLGIRDSRQADWVFSVLDGTHVLDTDLMDWRQAAKLGRVSSQARGVVSLCRIS